MAAEDTTNDAASASLADAVRDNLDQQGINEQDIAAAVVWARTKLSYQTAKRSDEL
jgi:hypothetical protein